MNDWYAHKISHRVYFSIYHLWAANHLSELANEIELCHSGKPKFDIKHRCYVTNAIFSSVAFLEAVINELYQDAADNYSIHIPSLTKDQRLILADYWDMTEQKNRSHTSMLNKYKLALRFCGQARFDEKKPPFEDVNLLIKLRNTLVHYKPESLAADDAHDLTKKLLRRFDENRLMTGSGNPYFPDKCLGSGCARWAADSAKGLTDQFFNSIGLIPYYQKVDFMTLGNLANEDT